MTPTLWALVGLMLASALLCVWAALTGRPDSAPDPRHAAWGDGRTQPLVDDDPTRPIRMAPSQRWYDEHPWPHDGPHGWGPIRN